MDPKPVKSKRTGIILNVMRVLSWISFLVLCIYAGAIVFSYAMTLYNPEAAHNMYNGLDMYSLRNSSLGRFTISVFFIAALPGMQAWVVYLIIRILSVVKLTSPFTRPVALDLQRISIILLGIYLMAILNNAHNAWLLQRQEVVDVDWPAESMFFMAGLVFIISQVFRRGIEIQEENDLTI